MYNYIALWFSMSMEVTTYQLASSLIAKGMDWKQAVGTVLLGNLIVLIPMLLNAHAGAKYGIPFPVFIRAPFGCAGLTCPPFSGQLLPVAGSGFSRGLVAWRFTPCSRWCGPRWPRWTGFAGLAFWASGC